MALENGTRRECRPNLLRFSVNSTNSLTMAERNVLLIVLAELPGKMDFWFWRVFWDEFRNWLLGGGEDICDPTPWLMESGVSQTPDLNRFSSTAQTLMRCAPG